ncbi:OmpW/AlkL family protein [Frigidibacter oleivorans]|uniref:OmpW/AlkL family protein n=1 Tax=Frigidibacter oleivorans TaxID=2487129 RepID=UPI000F8CD1A1|nr:OmpW family outer membrane protein [Frigidibacter oleivorans]
MTTKIIAPAALAAAIAAALAGVPAQAQQAGDFTLGLGLGYVAPKDGNGTLAGLSADVDDDIRPTITFEYFIRDNLGIEVLAATPFEHDVKLDGLGRVGSVQHLPPVVSIQYHFDATPVLKPFVGVGLNYTIFFEEETRGALAGTKLKLEDSVGLALHAGFDAKVSDRGAVRADIRWMDIDSEVKLDGTKIGTAKIDPVVMGVSYVHRF